MGWMGCCLFDFVTDERGFRSIAKAAIINPKPRHKTLRRKMVLEMELHNTLHPANSSLTSFVIRLS